MHPEERYDTLNSGVRIESLARADQLIKRVYALLAATFAVYAVSTYLTLTFALTTAFTAIPRGGVGGLLFLGVFFLMCFFIEKNRHNTVGMVLLFVLVGMLGFMSAPALFIVNAQKGPSLLITAAVMTMSVFAVMSIVAFKTGFKSTALDNFMAVGSIVVLVGIVVSLFTDLGVFSIALSGLLIIFFSMLIMYQTKRLIEGQEDSAVSVVLSLFLSVYNIFWSIVNILYSR